MKTIIEIAISHQRQMASVHPHAIIGTIEDAIIEYALQSQDDLRAENAELKKQLEIYKQMTGEKIPDVKTFTATALCCDVCGRHPAAIIQTQFGTYCREHARYF